MLKFKKDCTGCMACMNICPQNAIIKRTDKYGYTRPVVIKEKCNNCGLCETVCPLNLVKSKNKNVPLKAFSMYHKDERAVEMSSSGGTFLALASKVVNDGGICFGCIYDVKEKRARLADTDHVDLKQILKSKYVESDIDYGFREVEKQLKTGRKVLFCATPCQVAGLALFLQKPYDNLLLVDFTCGAVSAQTYLADYLQTLEKRYNSKISDVNFRDKKYGWGQYCFTVHFENGRVYRKTAMQDPYFFCFLRSSMQRLSCHCCRFSDRHYSDIVLADFWKCDLLSTDKNDRRGISLVLALTKKGELALKEIENVMNTEALDIEEASYNLQGREFSNDKLGEIYSHQRCARKKGVAVLRKALLGPKMRFYYAVRQFIMDHPRLAKHCPKIVGNGQIRK